MTEIRYLMGVWLALALAFGLPIAALSFFTREPRRPLLRPQRPNRVRWTGVEVWLALLIAFITPGLITEFLTQAGFFKVLYENSDKFAFPVRLLWAMPLVLPAELLLILGSFRLLSNTPPRELGFSFRRCARDVRAGYLVWLVVAPLANLLNDLLSRLTPPQPHDLARLVEGHPGVPEWLLAGLEAVVAAPILEELLFRGVLQPWLSRRSWGGLAAVAGALAFSSAQAYGVFRDPNDKAAGGSISVLQTVSPVLFVIAMIPGYFIFPRAICRWVAFPDVSRALYGTALLFAAAHSSYWPTPVPLFLLGLALGWLAYRTRNLVGPIVAHALFNAVAVLLLVAQSLASNQAEEDRSAKGSPVTTARVRSVPVSTSTAVPGSWWPRRR